MPGMSCISSHRTAILRAILLLGVVMAALVMSLSCGSDDEVKDKVSPPNFSIEVDPGAVDTLCCATEVVSLISGVSPPGGRYYWAGLHVDDSLVLYGSPVFISAGIYTEFPIGVQVSYLDQVPSGEYDVTIYASDEYGDVGDIHSRATATAAGVTEVTSYVDSQCTDCCTGEGDTIFYSNGDTVVGLRRYKALAMKRVSDADFAMASIDTKYGRLCAEGSSAAATEDAQQNCFVVIMEHAGQHASLPTQIQCGWLHERRGGIVDTSVYFEVTYSTGISGLYRLDWQNGVSIPTDGSQHEYAVVRMNDTILAGLYDGRLLVRLTDPGWAGLPIEYVSWQGEIAGRETDMPGTWGDTCEFHNCKYRCTGGTEQSAAFDNTSASDTLLVTPQRSGRPPEWGIDYRVGTGDFWIWDEDPL